MGDVRIDLHAHTTASDGTTSPTELVSQAHDAGLDVVAITDHDTAVGWDEAVDAARLQGVGLVRGMEMSTRYHGMSVHLLAYLHDRDNPALVAELARTREQRAARVRAMVDKLARDYPLTWDDVVAQADGATAVLGRPHIADALVAAGIVPDRSAAFEHLVSTSGPYYVRYHPTPTDQAVALVRAAGGVPVLAHPGAESRGQILPDDAIATLVDIGLAGVEAHHRDHSPVQVARLVALASRWDLLVTGASDFHGTGKPNRLGENLTTGDVLDAIAAQGVTCVVM